MAYLEEFRSQLNARNYSKVMQLWEEYCAGDIADKEEICDILELIKTSEFAKHFGQYVEAILPLVELIEKEEDKQEIYRLIIDLQTTNSPALLELVSNYLKKHYNDTSLFNDKMRLIGLRGAPTFQGAISNFILLNHLQKGNFVLHTAGWGVGEIMDVSFLREQASIEFENLHGGKRDLSFQNAFKTVIPVAKTHFLARRFSDPDSLEKDAKENPVEVIRCLLRDLGPKTASEIKDEMEELVIPEKEYSKWWQGARAKLKKDPLIETPELSKEPFRLRRGHASWEERLEKTFLGKHSFDAIIGACYNSIRDFPELLKNEAAKARLIEKIQGLLLREKATEVEHLQVLLFLENPLGVTLEESALKKSVLKLDKIEEILNKIELPALKRRLLAAVREYRNDWAKIYLELLFALESNQLRDLLMKEVSTPEHSEELKRKIQELLHHPKKSPEAFLWYFQKVLNDEAPYFTETSDKYLFIESLLILFDYLDNKPEYRDLAKKIYTLLTAHRFQVVRDFLKPSSKEFAKEFLLLTSKCHGFSDHDKKILRSLVEVVHPELVKDKKEEKEILHVIWTTQTGFNFVQERIKRIGTVEMVDVAKEIEVARSHGDLRENAEYKSALERRSHLQNELKMLSDQFHNARVITKADISTQHVGVGTKVQLQDSKGKKVSYTILGPWDANPDRFILSFQSKLAEAMDGKKIGDTFSFKGDEFKVLSISGYEE